MCERTKLVPIPEFMRVGYQDIFEDNNYGPAKEFDIDAEGRQCFALDECITPAIEALWAAGIKTLGCCCGHGSGHGVISIEVPNGGDTARRDRQAQYFYKAISENNEWPLHQFG